MQAPILQIRGVPFSDTCNVCSKLRRLFSHIFYLYRDVHNGDMWLIAPGTHSHTPNIELFA
jgi:hypothetical protein